jgi:hypothetical protein
LKEATAAAMPLTMHVFDFILVLFSFVYAAAVTGGKVESR